MAIPLKMTRSHQVTLPKRLLEQAGWLKQDFFVAELKGDYLVLKPMTLESRPPVANFEDLRRHFKRIGITQQDVHNAVQWARSQSQSQKKRHS